MPQLENTLSIACGSKQCRKKLKTTAKLPSESCLGRNIRKITKLNFVSYSGAQFYKQFIGQPKSFLPNYVFFSQLLVFQRQTFGRHLGKKSKKDIQIFNRVHSMMIARVDFESLWTNFHDPSALLVFWFMFFFQWFTVSPRTHSIELYRWHFISQYFVESMRSRIYYIICKQPIQALNDIEPNIYHNWIKVMLQHSVMTLSQHCFE